MLVNTEMQRHCKIFQVSEESRKYSDKDHAILGTKHYIVPDDGHMYTDIIMYPSKIMESLTWNRSM